MRYRTKYIVSDSHRFVYFVVQKAACTSIKTALAPLFGIETGTLEKPRNEAGLRFVVHELFDRSENQIGKDRFLECLDGPCSGYFKFAFVRNPYDRLVSCYSDKVLGGRQNFIAPENASANLYTGMPFGEFVEAVCEIPDEQANPHFRSQYVTVCGPEGEIMADFVGRFENLAEDFGRVASQIGNGRDLALPNLLASTRKGRHYSEFYTDRSRRLVQKRYEEDIEIFDYAF